MLFDSNGQTGGGTLMDGGVSGRGAGVIGSQDVLPASVAGVKRLI
jgi:hypothetical protein